MPHHTSKPRKGYSPLHVSLIHAQILLLLLTPCTQAGDILRMGGASGTSSAVAGTPATTSGSVNDAAATAEARSNAQDMLARNSMALQAVTAMQQAAHAAAAGATNLGANPNYAGQTLPDVPNGLGTGGLDIIGSPVGANAPQQSLENAHTIVTIQQTQQQALLNWQTFNVGSDTTVKFDQSAGGADVGNWIAFNQITDPSGNPTQILGSIQAQGQVYIINQNGIIFGGGSEVNTHALVASALPLNDNLVTRGLLNNPDSQFLFSANAQAAGTKGPTPAFTPPSLPAFGKIGDVTVQKGAQITAPTSSDNVGGRVMLVAPNVTNEGTISTPDGQTILAAGMQVGVTAHSTSDPSLRGLDVYVGDVGSYGGTVTNNGLITAPRGDITIAGKTVNQNGFLSSTTSASFNGRIDIDTSYNAFSNVNYSPSERPLDLPFIKASTGSVTFAAGSVAQILPEWSSTLTVVGTELALQSQINITGLTVYFAAETANASAAIVYAPNAQVMISAGVWSYYLATQSLNYLIHTDGQIYLGEGAVIDVQGSTDVSVPVTQYIQNITLRGAELANSPVQRDGILRGSTITVDLRQTGVRADGSVWYGTPLADLTGYVGIIQRTVGELTIGGGTVTLNAGGSVVLQPGSVINVSAGWINYGGSSIQTTQLITNGQIVDIANADPSISYDAIYTGTYSSTDPRYSVTSSSSALFTPGVYYANGYLSGGNGGTLSVTAPAMAIDGTLTGIAVSGPLQRATPVTSSTLNLTWQSDLSGYPDFFFQSATPPAITFSTSQTQTPAASFAVDSNGKPLPLSADRMNNVVLSPDLLSSTGFGHLNVVNYDGTILLPQDVSLQTLPSGSISLAGANVTILGSIISPGGSISLTAYNISPATMAYLSRIPPLSDPAANAGRGLLTIGSSAVLSTAGLLVDNTTAAADSAYTPLVTKGGSILLQAYNVDVQTRSVLNVSGGVIVGSNNLRLYGNGGSISILAGRNPSYTYIKDTQTITLELKGITGGSLSLNGDLFGYSGETGGSLTLMAQQVQVGGSSSNPQMLVLGADFFSKGGFTNFTLTGLGAVNGSDYLPGINITAGTIITPQALSYVTSSNITDSSGLTLIPTLLAEGVRKPVSLNFNTPGVTDDYSNLLVIRGGIVMDAGASIVLDSQASISFLGETASILGRITAPGGSISLKFGEHLHTLLSQDYPEPTLFLGSGSLLSTAGKVLLVPDVFGRRTGTVLNGGTISLDGNLVISTGAVIDVSGASGTLDVNTAYLGSGTSGSSTSQSVPLVNFITQSTRVDSNAGTVTLKGGEEMFVDGQLLGAAGGSTGLGGTLVVSSGRYYSPTTNEIKDPRDINLWVSQSGPVLPAGYAGLGSAVKTAGGSLVPGAGYIAADTFMQGGFDSLALNGNVGFIGPVNITAAGSLSVATGGIIQAGDSVNLTASYISLGRAFLTPQQPQEVITPYLKDDGSGHESYFYFSPTYGTGNLTVTANLIDVGTLSLQGIGQLNLIADHGDIRGDGVLDVAGSIYMRAAQIYPPTAVNFTIAAYDYQSGGSTHAGSVTVVGSGQNALPLSAGGTLSIYATQITQGGTLVAPFGTINLGWDGIGGWDGAQTAPVDLITNLTVPITTQLTLSSGSRTSVSAVDPLTGLALTIPYGVNLNGTSWIDPRGIDITGGGGPTKAIHLAALNVSTQSGSVIDLSGGGDLYAYRWVSGNGGTTDALDTTSSFAILPGYSSNYAPFGAYNSTSSSSTLGTDTGYVNSTLKPGDQIYLNASSGLAAGVYTLLPARYALMPGAFLVTPQSMIPVGTLKLPSGASYVDGYVLQTMNTRGATPVLMSSFEVASSTVVRTYSQYENYSASSFLKSQSAVLGVNTPELPLDAGHAVLQAVQSMLLQGTVLGQAATGGQGALVDISSPVDIIITAPGAPAVSGKLQLDSSELSRIGAGSLLIGGVRSTAIDGTHILVRTNNITLDNAGSPLSGPEIIMTANQVLDLRPGAVISQSSGSTSSTAETLILGSTGTAGSGNGALLRLSSNSNASITRLGRTSSTIPDLIVGTNVLLQGTSLTLDTTYGTSLAASANLSASDISLNSGSIILQLDSSLNNVPSTAGLLLSGTALQSLSNAKSLSLLSYSTFDTYGSGTVGNMALTTLSIHAGQIRGFDQGSGTVTFTAQSILLDNSANGNAASSSGGSGTLAFSTGLMRLGSGSLQVNQFSNVQIQATAGVQLEGTGGFVTDGTAVISAPFITGLAGATQSITASGSLMVQSLGSSTPATAGLGASLTLQGLTVEVDNLIQLPSGSFSALATGGDVTVNGTLNLPGLKMVFQDLNKYTSGGQIALTSRAGNVVVGTNALLNVSADSGGGNAGSISVSASLGTLLLSTPGSISGTGGTGGVNGSFTLDVDHLGALALSAISGTASSSFTESLSVRVRTGDVTINDAIKAHQFLLAADSGSITVSSSGKIDASGTTGGAIRLVARNNVTLQGDSIHGTGAQLTVAAQKFDSAGKGGQISLEAGAAAISGGIYSVGTGTVDIQEGTSINLSVAALTSASAGLGQFSGTLHLRAPQISGGTDVSINAIQGTIIGASSVTVEGYFIQDLTSSGGTITSTVQNNVKTNGNTFLGSGYTAMYNRIVGTNPANSGLGTVLVIQPGAEIVNTNGNLTLGTTTSTTTSDWNLSTFRFGTKSAPGVLTLRAAGNLVFYNALSDGFSPTLANTDATWLWLAPVTTQVSTLPVNTQSWSYHLTAGADLGSVDFHSVQPLSQLGSATGSIQLGKNGGLALPTVNGSSALTSTALTKLYQVIRTGTGEIDISAGRDVQLLNQFATIYTAGVGILNPTGVLTANDFVLPVVVKGGTQPNQGVLGSVQQQYAASYTMAGGNVYVYAGNDITHLTQNTAGTLVADSERQLPINWLYRRGNVDPTTGLFGSAGTTGPTPTVVNDPTASTTWWVDFSNFFEGVGALGGGNVSLKAGRDVVNVDAVAPTNARMSGRDPTTGLNIAPNSNNMVELGGGNVTVNAGRNIDGGVYYVERGQGVLQAGNSITTNATRTISLGILNGFNTPSVLDSSTWMPTTLFIGKGSFNVSARKDVLLGPVANVFLLPQGLNNRYWYKSYFSTYSADSSVNVSSLGGQITFRESANIGVSDSNPMLYLWLQNVLLFNPNTTTSASYYQPWLRLDESFVGAFSTTVTLQPPSLKATAFTGDINLAGPMNLYPSATGTIDLVAAGAVNGLRPTGTSSTLVPGKTVVSWTSSTINLSDANPASIPGITNPFAYANVAGIGKGTVANASSSNFLSFINNLFSETGSTQGSAAVLQTKQALHAPGVLHANDLIPAHIYAGTGDITGLTFYSAKSAQVIAGNNISDIALYIQNTQQTSLSVVAAGNDILAYNDNTAARIQSRLTGNALTLGQSALAGDIQISGPGSLEVLAGRNIDLGTGSTNSNGTGDGITSIGNGRNPYLPFGGADLVVAAGMGGASLGLAGSGTSFTSFISQFATSPAGDRYLSELADILGVPSINLNNPQLTPEQQKQLALAIFYLVLRDSGRDHNDPNSPNAGTYTNGYDAISSLFPTTSVGSINTQARDIRTKSGGDISILAPDGGLQLAATTIGSTLAPPGIITEAGGSINIFTKDSVDIGISRIFTLKGGDIMIWSSTGDIAAGSSSKTVQSAPPTRVLIDPQSANVATDLAGLATGGGIGVLASLAGVKPGNVDLIAPVGAVDAGDAGIRATGNLNIAATIVLNAANIAVGGTTAGTPAAPSVAAPSLGGLASAASAGAATTAAASQTASQAQQQQQASTEVPPSIITVEVIGYGGGSGDERKRNDQPGE